MSWWKISKTDGCFAETVYGCTDCNLLGSSTLYGQIMAAFISCLLWPYQPSQLLNEWYNLVIKSSHRHDPGTKKNFKRYPGMLWQRIPGTNSWFAEMSHGCTHWNIQELLTSHTWCMVISQCWYSCTFGRALHSPTSLCRLYIDYRESTGSPLGVEWEWSGSAYQDHVDGRFT